MYQFPKFLHGPKAFEKFGKLDAFRENDPRDGDVRGRSRLLARLTEKWRGPSNSPARNDRVTLIKEKGNGTRHRDHRKNNCVTVKRNRFITRETRK